MGRQILIAVSAIVLVNLCNQSAFADPVHVTIRQKKPKKPKPVHAKNPKKGSAAATADVASTPTLTAPVMSPTGSSGGSDAGLVSVPTNNVTTVQGSATTNFGSTNQTTTASTTTSSDTITTGANSLVSNPQAVGSVIFSDPFTQATAMGAITTATQPVGNGVSYFIGGANPGVVTVPNNIVSTSNLPIDYGQGTSPGLIPNTLTPNIPRPVSQQVSINNTPLVGGGTSVSLTNNNGVIGVPSPSFGGNQTVNTGSGNVTFPSTNIPTNGATQFITTTSTGAVGGTTGTTTGNIGNPGTGTSGTGAIGPTTTGTTTGTTGATTTGSTSNSVSTVVLPQSTITTNNPTVVNGNVVGVPSGTTVVANTTGVTGTTNNILGVSGSTSSNLVGAFPVNIGAPLATGGVTSTQTGNLGGVFTDGIGAQNLSGGIAPNLGTIGQSPNVGGFTAGIGSSSLAGGGAGTGGGGSNF
jgi:hypothetical protein